jgi:hypothetical protein
VTSLTLVVLQRDLLELAVDNSLAFEVRSGVANSGVGSQRRHGVLFRRCKEDKRKISLSFRFCWAARGQRLESEACISERIGSFK